MEKKVQKDSSTNSPHKTSLSFSGVSAGFPSFKIDNINFSLEQGDVLGLIGQSGSGKSTILKTLIGELHPLKGSVEVHINNNSRDIRDVVGYSPQENSLFPNLTVQENVLTFAKLKGMSTYDALKHMKELLVKFDLKNTERKRVSQLSGGMRKRLDILVAIIHRPPILILDEPFNGLDIAIQDFIWTLLVDFAKEGNIVVVSSHMIEDIHKFTNKKGLVYRHHFYHEDEIKNSMHKMGANFTDYIREVFEQGRNV